MKFSMQLTALLGVATTAFACDEHSSSTKPGRPGRPTTTSKAVKSTTTTPVRVATTSASADVPTTIQTTTRDSSARASTTTTSASTPSGTGTIWQPAVGAKWQIVLNKKVNLANIGDAPIVDFDLVENTNNGASKATIDTLHAAGKKVICYFSAGTSEDWRPDYSKFTAAEKGAALPDWKGENWLDTRSANVRSIMSARIAMAAKVGCDGIDPDNMDAYNNQNGGGFGLKQADAVDYVSFLSGEARKNNLSMGLKNAGEIIPAVIGMVQFSVNEQCSEMRECKTFASFITAGKPVFHIEYPYEEDSELTQAEMCVKDASGADLTKFSTVQKNMDLDEFVKYC